LKNRILYICFGDIQYFNEVKFSILTLIATSDLESQNCEINVLTDKPEEFSHYPVKTVNISPEQIKDWSINGSYNFRVKNRGMSFFMDSIVEKEEYKILYLDTDTYFKNFPVAVFNKISKSHSILYLNEGSVYKKKRFSEYKNALKGRQIILKDFIYTLNNDSHVWGSLMIGISSENKFIIDMADQLMLEFYRDIKIHTIEEFALSECIKIYSEISEGRKFLCNYSTSGKKRYVRPILEKFFKKYGNNDIRTQAEQASNLKLNRPFLEIIKQRIDRILE